jgi:alcohol dehydrogenase class IV
MRFEFATAAQVLFGVGVRETLPEHVRRYGRRVALVTGSTTRAMPLISRFVDLGYELSVFRLAHEPTLEDARQAAEDAADQGADAVIAIGGGSVIDLGKAAAALAANGGDPLDYVEVIGRGQPLARPPLPFIAVPTTAGTGSEVTRNAVLASPEDGVKVSLRSPSMLPRLALVDPELTLDLPPALTAATGMDALTQLVEPFVSVKATAITDALCLDGLPRVVRSLRRAHSDGSDLAARSEMALASLYSGMALANAGLGVVHGFAAVVGGRFPAPHGAVCAALLPGAVRVNLRVARASGSPAVERFAVVARTLTGRPDARAEDAVEWLDRLRDDLGIPRLGAYGVSAADGPALAEAAARASSTKGNPVPLSDEDLHEVLTAAL